MTRSRSRLITTFVALACFGGCGTDAREVTSSGSRESGGSGTVEPATGGNSSGGADVASGGATGGQSPMGGDDGSGGSDGSGGAGGTTSPTGGMGGQGGDPGEVPGPIEPPIVACEPLAALPPMNRCPPGPFPAEPLLDGEDELVLCTKAMGIEWAEGPIWSADDATLLFSNFDEEDVAGLFNGNLMRYREGEGCTDVLAQVGTNGLAWGPAGTLITGRQTNRTLSRLDLAAGTFCSLADTFEGSRFSSPNDVAVRSDGNIYFTDPAWNLGSREEELPQSLYRITPDGSISLVKIYPQLRPNGVSLSPDETRLYLAIEGAIVVFDVDTVGALSNERDFVTGVSVDGMAVDCAGNVYASTGHVYSPAGELIGEFWGGTNLAFGGADGQTLYITGHRRLTSLRVAIPGLPY